MDAMSRTRPRSLALVAAALVALTALTGTAAAAPGNTDQANSSDDHEAGPPGDLPGPVPDFVEEIHAQIQAFLDRRVDDLGAAVSDIAGSNADTGDDESSDGSAR
jgi:hypothetical protein